MNDILFSDLHSYIAANNPDLMISLQEEGKLTTYLTTKIVTVTDMIRSLQDAAQPEYLIREQCMNILTADLRPSRFNYLLTILEDEFGDLYWQLHESGMLTYEALNILSECKEAFERYGFNTDNEDNKWLRYEITGIIEEYRNK